MKGYFSFKGVIIIKTFSRNHPIVPFFYFAAVLIITMFSTNPVILGLSLLGSVFGCFILLQKQAFLKSLYFIIPMLLIVTVTNPLFSRQGDTVLFNIKSLSVTLESLIYGVVISVMLAAVILWFNCFNKVVTNDKLMFLFSKIMPKITLTLSSALKFIPSFKRHTQSVMNTQKVMGMYSNDSLHDKIRGMARATSSVMTWSLETSVDTSDSMRARGYCVQKRSSYSNYKFTADDLKTLIIITACTVLTIIGIGYGSLDFEYYPRIAKLQITPLSVTSYISFLILILLPIITQIKEKIKWKYSMSKI